MKQNMSRQFFSNKSGMIQKKNSNLVINTRLQNAFDSRWAEIKIEGRNINSRSNHISFIFRTSLFVHGGYDVDRGIVDDFNQMDISEDCQEFVWKKLNNTCDGKQIKLKGHTAVIYKQALYVFGGERATNLSNNLVYVFTFLTKTWKSIPPSIKVPKIDSHGAVAIGDKMYIYGGYDSDSAEYLTDIYEFNLETHKWSVYYQGGKSSEPEGRSSFSMIEYSQNLIIFGGTNGSKTLNDMWIFEVKAKTWKRIEGRDTPDPRRGHSMVRYEDYLFLFGGIQDVTKEKNDILIFQVATSQWNKIHTTTNSVYDCSPTLKRNQRKNKSPQLIASIRFSPQKSERGMKKILEENKHKKFMEKKKELLSQFNQRVPNIKKRRELSPTTESMLKTLEAIGNQQTTHRELKQEIVYDDTHRFIIGKKPCARDGQSVTVFGERMIIFGGDRHLMAFNDLYQFDLGKGVKSLELYKR